MEFSHLDLLSPQMILADVLEELQDSEQSLFTPGWYTSQVQQALEELGFDTFFETQEQIVDIPDSMKVYIPKGCFNLKEIYLVTMDDCCTITGSQNVYWKDRFRTNGYGNGYTARNQYGLNDAFVQGYNPPTDLYWFNVVNGIIHLSDSCNTYSKLKIIYNGVMGTIGETPYIPRIFRQAVKGWVADAAYKSLKARDQRKYTPLWRDNHQITFAPYTGTWDVAKQRAAGLDAKMLSDLKEYLCSMNT